MKAFFGLVICFFLMLPIVNAGSMVFSSIDISLHVTQPLVQASAFQNPNDALPFFERSLKYLKSHNMSQGNTCIVLSSTPSCNLSNFTEKLATDITLLKELKELPISDMRVSTGLSRVHQSLYTRGEKGDHISLPDLSFAHRWGTGWMKPIGKVVDWLSGILGIIAFIAFTAS